MTPDPTTCSRRTACITATALALPLGGWAPFATAASPRALPVADPSAPMLATVYRGQVEPALCLVSEKYDGVRAVWDGRVLRHRSGRVVAAPAAFVAALPGVPLDGELWLGRGRFDAVSGIVRKVEPRPAEWAAVRYVVFDMPGGAGTFADRAERLQACVAKAGAGPLHCAEQSRVTDRAALQRRLDDVVAAGGEGLMLHRANALWQGGRSEALMKLKPHLDAEAEVVAYRAGAGRNAGQVGALEVQAPDGRRFFVGSGLSDALRRDPPRRGDVVTYRYRDVTPSGLPRFPTYLRRHVTL